MPRFYCALPLTIGARLDLPEEIAHHVFVLRLQSGDKIELFNGEGGAYVAVLNEIGKKRAIAEIKLHLTHECELPFGLSLAQALPEGSKMDWIIEKAIELGVNSIQPLAAQRSVVKLNAERAEKKSRHWHSIITAASEQCGRNRIAHLGELVEVQKWLQQQDIHKRILLTPRSDQSLAEWARHHPAQAVTIMVGPEGGFSDAEEDWAIQHGALALNMGPRILRTETAGLSAISILSSAWGGM